MHPECEPEVVKLADFVGSTAEIIAYAKSDAGDAYIICTEYGVEYKLMTDNPHKRFYFPVPTPCCPGMKLNTLQRLWEVLQSETNEEQITQDQRRNALIPLDKMLELAK